MIRARGFDLGRNSRRKKANGKKKAKRSRCKRNDFIVNSIAEIVEDEPLDKELPNSKRSKQAASDDIDELLDYVAEDKIMGGESNERQLRPRAKVKASDSSIWQKYVS